MYKYLILLSVSLIFRLFWLGSIPVSLSHDELDLMIQAHSVINKGSDIVGDYKPWRLLPNSGLMAELGPLINVPILSVFPNNLFTIHLTTALLSSIYPLIVVLLLMLWGFPSRMSYLAGVLLAISPWHILFSRTALEQPASLFFYTFSWIFLTKLFQVKKSPYSSILYSLFFVLAYVLGFYTYHGYKFTLPLITLLISVFLFHRSKLSNRLMILFIPFFVVGGLLSRTYLLRDLYSSRSSEIIFLDTESISSQVDHDRKVSLAPSLFQNIFNNKLTVSLELLKDKYLEVLSPSHIFEIGDQNGIFSTGRTGYLYLISLPFLAISIATMLLRRSASDYFMLAWLLLAPLSTIIHSNSDMGFRSGIYFVVLTILTAHGLYTTARHFHSRIFWLCIIAIYFLSFTKFIYVYFSQYPVEGASSHFFEERVLAKYINLAKPKRILVITSQPRYLLSNLILLNSHVTRDDIDQFGSSYSPSDLDRYHLPFVTILRDCPLGNENSQFDTVIVEVKSLANDLLKCPSITAQASVESLPMRYIVDPLDSGSKYVIYGDKLCSDFEYDLSTYVKPSYTAFALEGMTSVQFCHNWIVSR